MKKPKYSDKATFQSEAGKNSQITVSIARGRTSINVPGEIKPEQARDLQIAVDRVMQHYGG